MDPIAFRKDIHIAVSLLILPIVADARIIEISLTHFNYF